MYFVGVTTGQSSIHRVFPRWVEIAGAPDAQITGLDIAVDSGSAAYRGALETMLADPDSAGALVTSHKVPVFEHGRDLFSQFDQDAELLGEVSCIVQRGRRMRGLAVDTVTSGLALDSIVERPFRGGVLIFGAGGAGVALAVHMERHDRAERLVLADVSASRAGFAAGVTRAECLQVTSAAESDRLLGSMPAGSLIVNATGMGKDRPGSPISPAARFPNDAIARDFNYRGDLRFLEQARAQGIRAVDGWQYFLHGWSEIMARVLDFELTPHLFARMVAAAER